MHEASLSYHEMESGIAGTYAPNRSLIRLQKASAFWEKDWAGTPEAYAVFLHEYAHYLHNYSTGAGVTELIYEMSIAQIFMMTVDASGHSRGIEILDPWLQKHYQSLQEFRRIVRGNYHLPPGAAIHRRSSKIRYVSHEISIECIKFPKQGNTEIERVTVEVEVGSSSAEPTKHIIELGSSMVMEGVAFELECFHLERRGVNIEAYAVNAPPAPYKIARRVLEGITGSTLSHSQCIKACLLALQSTNPGYALVDVANRMRRAPEAPDKALDAIAANVCGWMQTDAISALLAALCDQTRVFSARPLLTRSMNWFEQQIRTYMAARVKTPFFELDLGNLDVASQGLYAFFERFPPCAVQIIDEQSSLPAPLAYVWGQAVDVDLVDSLAGYHAMMDFALAHCSTGLGSTASARMRKCPFNESCSLPTKQTSPDVCMKTPWRTFDPSVAQQCWYGAGVGASRGMAKIVDNGHAN